jgi:hypothetical protein
MTRPRLTLSEGDIQVIDVDSGRPWLMAAADVEVMSMEPHDYWDLRDDRPRPPPPPAPSDLTDSHTDGDDHDGDAYKWP